ncbi:anti-repressor SinI family protein [Gorillibacterium sp. CAU 1737]
MNQPIQAKADDFDQEWIDLIMEAYEMGMSFEEVKDFFRRSNRMPIAL